MAEKNKSNNIFNRLGRGFINFFKNIGKRFSDVRLELKRVIWPTKQKLIQTSIVVLVVIGIAAVLLYGISEGSKALLTKIGFYDQVAETTASTVLPSDTTPSASLSETTASAESSDTEPAA
jgi:preprotein translocase subunit SecE